MLEAVRNLCGLSHFFQISPIRFEVGKADVEVIVAGSDCPGLLVLPGVRRFTFELPEHEIKDLSKVLAFTFHNWMSADKWFNGFSCHFRCRHSNTLAPVYISGYFN